MIEWRDDCFGRPCQALYLGNLYVGSINHWDGDRRKETPWRGWFMSEDDGNETGWFACENDARNSIEDALWAALEGVLAP